jgi:hypothetical protein
MKSGYVIKALDELGWLLITSIIDMVVMALCITGVIPAKLDDGRLQVLYIALAIGILVFLICLLFIIKSIFGSKNK